MNPFVADPHWGWWIVAYFYLGGLAAGCYFVATLIELFGRDEDRPVARLGYRVAFPLICMCGVLLIVDLDRPERFWHMMLQSEVVNQALEEGWPLGGWQAMVHALMLKWWSPMSIGALALGVFGLCSTLSLIGTFRPKGRLAYVLDSHLVGRSFKVLGSAVGFFVASYTGVLLTATNQPLWSDSDWIGPLFLTSAASTGIALLLLLDGRIAAESRERLERADLVALTLELFVFLVFVASLGNVLTLALETWEGLLLVLGTLILGVLVPLGLHLGRWAGIPILTHAGQDRNPDLRRRATLAALSALAGGFLLRFGIVSVAPALLHQFPDVTPRMVEDPVWQSWVGKALLIATFVAAVSLPCALTLHWQLSVRSPTAVGMVVVSILTLVAVTFYSFSPASVQPLFDPLRGVSVSPEDQRSRGGGPGASASNRPTQPSLRSKLNEAP